ncbi:MAG: class I tRNA ligase family protein, partial [Lactobacillaceae bacterium]|nr:class I tRNA ligase family protein [Lactobacillaceae bacterium]
MKVKDTLHLGKTEFAMRAGLPTNEPVREKQWEDADLYFRRLEQNTLKPHWNLHDGPPYANGNIHLGHALNKISKDMIVRYKNMSGYLAPYVPGWDTHGLPIEQQLTKAGYNRKEMTTNEWRELARQYALEQVELQKADFKRLGVLGDWNNPYLTLQPEFEAQEIRVFKAMVEKDLIFRGTKPVYWSWSSESALAESEVEYEDMESTSAFYGNRVLDGKGVLEPGTQLVVWTTTPWTTPASEGISVGPEIDYSVVVVGDTKYVVASELLENLAEEFGWTDYSVEKTFKGQDIDRVTAQHPYRPEVELLVMNGEHVTLDAGTGLVHTAPGYGEDDFNIGNVYGLPVVAPIDDRGVLTKDAGKDFEGVFYQKSEPIALQKLEDAGVLLKTQVISHSYPMDWRTHKP